MIAGLILRASGQAHVPVSVQGSAVERAAELGRWMTVDPELDGPGGDGGEWTVQDVITTAVERGLDALEQLYLPPSRRSDPAR